VRVAVALSGGVDSAVAAFLLLQRGCEVVGVTFTTPYTQNCRCVADHLRIPLVELDFSALFERMVREYFLREYLRGRTPNPCVVCNEVLKFGAFLKEALRRTAAQFYATGHYVRILRAAEHRCLVLKGRDAEHDQSYFLVLTNAQVYERVLFPLGEMSKADVRTVAREARLPVDVERSSRDVCFAPAGYRSLFAANPRVRGGDIVDWKGRVVGRHDGLVHYTVGQRKGLRLRLGYPVYVQRLDVEQNRVIVAPRRLLYARSVLVHPVNFVGFERPKAPLRVRARCRYRQQDVPAVLLPQPASFREAPEGAAELRFEEAVFAPAVGQFAAFYCGDVLLGGGTVHSVLFPS